MSDDMTWKDDEFNNYLSIVYNKADIKYSNSILPYLKHKGRKDEISNNSRREQDPDSKSERRDSDSE